MEKYLTPMNRNHFPIGSGEIEDRIRKLLDWEPKTQDIQDEIDSLRNELKVVVSRELKNKTWQSDL